LDRLGHLCTQVLWHVATEAATEWEAYHSPGPYDPMGLSGFHLSALDGSPSWPIDVIVWGDVLKPRNQPRISPVSDAVVSTLDCTSWCQVSCAHCIEVLDGFFSNGHRRVSLIDCIVFPFWKNVRI
jgi:hypothetical protein